MKKRCVGYARVSTDEQSISIEHQVAFFKQYVNSNPQLELVDTFIDHGISGTDVKNRTEFLNMLSKVGVVYKSHKHFEAERVEGKLPYDVILVKDCSRFSRNLRQCLEIIECLKNNEVAVYFITENIFSDRASDLMMLQLLGTFSENFSRSLSEKIRLGHEMATKNSDRIHSTGRLYGFDYINGELRINEEEAKVVRLIYKLYTEDLKGLRAIGNILHDEGFRTRDNKRFSKNSILNILTNEKYYGCSNRGKHYVKGAFSKNGKTAHIKEDYMQYAKMSDKIEPIISKATFDKAQSILASRSEGTKGINHGNSKYATKVRCYKCNSSYTHNVDRGRSFYNCSLKRRQGIKACDNKNISEAKLDSIFTSEWLKQELQVIKLHRITHLNRVIRRLEASKGISHEDELNELRTRLNKAYEQESKLLDLYLEGIIEKTTYNSRKSKISEQINSFKSSIQQLSKPVDEVNEIIESKRKLIRDIQQLEIKDVYSEQEVLDYISCIKVNERELHVILLIEDEEVEIIEPIQL